MLVTYSFVRLSLVLLLAYFTETSGLKSSFRKLWFHISEQLPLGRIQTAKGPFTYDFNDRVDTVLQNWNVPGMSIAVIDGHRIHAKGFGVATFPNAAATPDTLYYIGSTTKAMLAAVLAHLIDSGSYSQLSRGWKTPISDIIRDDFVLSNEWLTAHLTLEDAVSHRTGFPRHDMSWYAEKGGKSVTIRDVVRNLRNLPSPLVPPRTEFHYNNLMFVTLQHVVETLTSRPLKDIFNETIWQPLEMNSSFLDLEEAKMSSAHLANSYSWIEERGEYEEAPFFPAKESGGAAGAISSVLDFSKWLYCLIHQTRPFSKEVHADIRTPRIISRPQLDGVSGLELYGLAWWRLVIHGHVAYFHSGSTLTYGAYTYWFPDLKYGLVAFANSNGFSNEVEKIVLQWLIEDRLGVPKDQRIDVEKRVRKQVTDLVTNFNNAEQVRFPDKPDPAKPSTRSSDLVGLYQNLGYGTIHLYERPNPLKKGQTILVADQSGLMIQHQVELHHVSGEYWLAYYKFPGSIPSETQYFRAYFNIGIDGRGRDLVIEFDDTWADVGSGPIVYTRVNQD